MKLDEAWLKIKGMENSNRFKPNQIYSLLADLGVFKTNPRLRLVLKSALLYDLWVIILSEDISISEIDLLKTKLLYDGFSDDI
ncbi:MAG: hypothetical protein K2H38_05700, partial [Muribaculaceae bacterium]|nr:hypothetical protein [Muribaculaceae bacterium]